MIRLLRILASLILALSTTVWADEAARPEFSNPPEKYINNHEYCTLTGSTEPNKAWECSTIDDELLIGDIEDSKLKFWLWIVGTNAHQCSMSGAAERTSTNEFSHTHSACNLKITLEPNMVKVQDIDAICRRDFCGTRASIGTIVFHK